MSYKCIIPSLPNLLIKEGKQFNPANAVCGQKRRSLLLFTARTLPIQLGNGAKESQTSCASVSAVAEARFSLSAPPRASRTTQMQPLKQHILFQTLNSVFYNLPHYGAFLCTQHALCIHNYAFSISMQPRCDLAKIRVHVFNAPQKQLPTHFTCSFVILKLQAKAFSRAIPGVQPVGFRSVGRL